MCWPSQSSHDPFRKSLHLTMHGPALRNFSQNITRFLFCAMQYRPRPMQCHKQDVSNHVYQPMPDVLHQCLMSVRVCLQFVFVFATAAACVASQAMISAAFSIIKQSIALGCFPHLTVLHVSDKVSPDVCCLLICCTCIMQCTSHYSMHSQFHHSEASRTKLLTADSGGHCSGHLLQWWPL